MEKKLKGLTAAAFTPMNGKGELNLEIIPAYAEYIAKTDLAGVFVCGTTGESASLSVNERKAVLEEWIACAQGRFQVTAHVGGNSLSECMELAAHAEQVGASAISAHSPSYFKPQSIRDLVDFFVPITGLAPTTPFYYYHFPAQTGVMLPVEDFLRSAAERIPTLGGVKFTHNNFMEMSKCMDVEPEKLDVLNGYDELLLAGLAFGARSGVGSTYNYMPHLYASLVNAFVAGDLERALQLQKISIKVVDIIICHGGGVRGGKAIMNLLGINCGSARLPMTSFSSDEYKGLRKELQAVDFFTNVVYRG